MCYTSNIVLPICVCDQVRYDMSVTYEVIFEVIVFLRSYMVLFLCARICV